MMQKIILILSLLIILGIIFFIFYFNRAPKRQIPEGNNVVSPANGKIIEIKNINNSEIDFLKDDTENILEINDIKPPYQIVLIQLDFNDVHVQRAPIQGKIISQEYFSGRHKNALRPKNIEQLENQNEKNVVIFENKDISVGVVQVAGLIARRIRSFVKIGDEIKKGEIYGKIILGSQVVVILPQQTTLLASVGDLLIDGESIIAEY